MGRWSRAAIDTQQDFRKRSPLNAEMVSFPEREVKDSQFNVAELDTYKIATTRNSTSLQHKGMSRDYTLDDFSVDDVKLMPFEDNKETASKEDLQIIIDLVNKYRQLYKQTKNYRYFRVMRQLMPMGYNYTITWTSNYAGLRNMYFQRKNHQLTEWKEDFCTWVESLPYGKDLITYTN